MTPRNHDHASPPGDPSHRGPPPADDAERIAAELAALGEDPVGDDELAFLSTKAEDHDDVRTVATLVGLSTWEAPAHGLLPLERHRVWQRIARRAPAPVTDPHEPAANGRTGWRGLVAGLALVAGVVMLPRFDAPPAPTEEDRAATRSMGAAAREVLDILPGEQDGSRARALADGYAQRLDEARGDVR